jgi:hypothetical protein
MASNRDWLARSHEGLAVQAAATTAYLTGETLTRIGITGTVLNWYMTEFIPKHNAFVAALDNWRNPSERTPAKITTLLSAEIEFRASYRLLYNGYLRKNPLVTDTDLVEMGLPKHPSGGKTPPQPPSTLIEASADTSKLGIIGINYRDMNEKGTAKPKGVHGAEIVYAILDAPPSDWSQLTNSIFDTKTPAQLVFTGEQRGKTVYFALRWENTRGDKGPWSTIYSAIIP